MKPPFMEPTAGEATTMKPSAEPTDQEESYWTASLASQDVNHHDPVEHTSVSAAEAGASANNGRPFRHPEGMQRENSVYRRVPISAQMIPVELQDAFARTTTLKITGSSSRRAFARLFPIAACNCETESDGEGTTRTASIPSKNINNKDATEAMNAYNEEGGELDVFLPTTTLVRQVAACWIPPDDNPEEEQQSFPPPQAAKGVTAVERRLSLASDDEESLWKSEHESIPFDEEPEDRPIYLSPYNIPPSSGSYIYKEYYSGRTVSPTAFSPDPHSLPTTLFSSPVLRKDSTFEAAQKDQTTTIPSSDAKTKESTPNTDVVDEAQGQLANLRLSQKANTTSGFLLTPKEQQGDLQLISIDLSPILATNSSDAGLDFLKQGHKNKTSLLEELVGDDDDEPILVLPKEHLEESFYPEHHRVDLVMVTPPPFTPVETRDPFTYRTPSSACHSHSGRVWKDNASHSWATPPAPKKPPLIRASPAISVIALDGHIKTEKDTVLLPTPYRPKPRVTTNEPSMFGIGTTVESGISPSTSFLPQRRGRSPFHQVLPAGQIFIPPTVKNTAHPRIGTPLGWQDGNVLHPTLSNKKIKHSLSFEENEEERLCTPPPHSPLDQRVGSSTLSSITSPTGLGARRGSPGSDTISSNEARSSEAFFTGDHDSLMSRLTHPHDETFAHDHTFEHESLPANLSVQVPKMTSDAATLLMKRSYEPHPDYASPHENCSELEGLFLSSPNSAFTAKRRSSSPLPFRRSSPGVGLGLFGQWSHYRPNSPAPHQSLTGVLSSSHPSAFSPRSRIQSQPEQVRAQSAPQVKAPPFDSLL